MTGRFGTGFVARRVQFDKSERGNQSRSTCDRCRGKQITQTIAAIMPGNYDVALRDFNLELGPLALARLSEEFEERLVRA